MLERGLCRPLRSTDGQARGGFARSSGNAVCEQGGRSPDFSQVEGMAGPRHM